MTQLFMDSHESPERKRIGKKIYGDDLHILTLKTFDYIIGDGLIGIESKKAADLVASIHDKRFENQCTKMAKFREEYGTHCYFILQGSYKDIQNDPHYSWVTPKVWNGILASICEPKDMKIIPVDSDEMFWGAVDRLIYNYDKDQSVKHVDVIPNGSTIQEKMLKCIPGISDVHAKAILEVFTLNDLIEIDEKELLEVGGIGPKRASSIISAFQGSECFD